jgi:hypothetical protein
VCECERPFQQDNYRRLQVCEAELGDSKQILRRRHETRIKRSKHIVTSPTKQSVTVPELHGKLKFDYLVVYLIVSFVNPTD